MRSWKAERTRQAGVSVLLAERMLGVIAEDVHGEAGSSVPLLSWLPGEGRPIRGGQAEMGPREESKVLSTSLRSTEHPRPRSASQHPCPAAPGLSVDPPPADGELDPAHCWCLACWASGHGLTRSPSGLGGW